MAEGNLLEAGSDQENPQELATYWLGQIALGERKLKSFRTRGDQIVRRYKNKRAYNPTGLSMVGKKMNVLWSNVQTQKPVLFSQTPKPNVQRRNKDKDPVGRWASIVMERCLTNSLDMQPFDHTMNQNVEDLLLPGYAAAITEYKPTLEGDKVAWQAAITRYVHWKDQITNPARNWEETWFWGYKVYQTRKEVRATVLNGTISEEMPEGDVEKARRISTEIVLDHKEDKKQEEPAAKATVWCIWDKSTKRVLHIAPGWPTEPLAVMPPPVSFDDFYPIPRPLVATTASDSTIPVPDFDMYSDQADEIDMLTQRIYVLERSLRLRGLYPADMESIKQIMENANDQDMIGIENWAMLAERGGAAGLVLWFPIKDIAETLLQCIQARQEALTVMYQLTGVSDIMRGSTEPEETATAQQLKSQFGGIRVRERQRDVQRYIRDIIRLQGEIIAEHFSLETLQEMSGVKLLTQQQKQVLQQAQAVMQQYQQQAEAMQQAGQQPPPPPNLPQPTPEMIDALKEPTWEEVIGLLRNEKLRGFVIDIETDSTIEADQMMEQQKATEFVTATTQFVGAWLPVLQAAPNLAPLAGEMMMYAVRRYKAGETLETAIEEAVEQMEAAAQQPPPPDPKVQAAQIKAQAEQQKAQAAMQQTQIEAQARQQELQMELQAKQEEFQMEMIKLRAEMEAMQGELQIKRQEQQMAAEDQSRAQEAAEHGHGLKMEVMDAQAKAKQAAANGGPA
jgi:hypothetical protein